MGYRPITIAQLLDKNFSDVPAGMAPAVFVFDDASDSQFRYIEKDGKLEIDPTSGVGIWLLAMYSMASHDRAHIAHLRGDYALGARFAYEALRTNPDQFEQTRILGGLAAFLVILGVKSAARDAYLILASTSVEQSVRGW